MTVTLIHGDCLDVMRTLPDGAVDMVFADPPYNVGLKYATYADKLSKDEYLEWCAEWFQECRRISRSCVVVTPGMVSVPMWLAEIERTHFLIAWTKQNNCSRNYIGKTSGFQTWEPILVFGKAKRCVLRDSVDVPISRQKDTGNHPCPKPFKLLKWIVENFVDEGDTILDPFMGSGTTGVACVKTGRNFIGVEIDEGYYKIAERRIAEAQMQLPLLEAV
jgi:site-specific DNA-methyltransferase (adenine-specific)